VHRSYYDRGEIQSATTVKRGIQLKIPVSAAPPWLKKKARSSDGCSQSPTGLTRTAVTYAIADDNGPFACRVDFVDDMTASRRILDVSVQRQVGLLPPSPTRPATTVSVARDMGS